MSREVTLKQVEAYHTACLFGAKRRRACFSTQSNRRIFGRPFEPKRKGARKATWERRARRGNASPGRTAHSTGEEASSFDALVGEFVNRFAAAGIKALRPNIPSLRGAVVNWLNEQLNASPDLEFAVGSVHEAAPLSLTECAAWLLPAMPPVLREAAEVAKKKRGLIGATFSLALATVETLRTAEMSEIVAEWTLGQTYSLFRGLLTHMEVHAPGTIKPNVLIALKREFRKASDSPLF